MEIYQVDAFTAEAFGGNPAAVCILEEEKETPWLQNLASEMNLSETAFLYPQEKGYKLRWFTPKTEVDLCGHATLASAHILWETDRLDSGVAANFQTRSGLLKAERNDGWIELDFPAQSVEKMDPPIELLDALEVEPKYVGQSKFDYLIEVEKEATINNLSPDFGLLSQVETRGVIVTSSSESEQYDFVSRFFAPAVGVDEDPATGSSHCCLGFFWQEKLGKDEMVARQLSARGGILKVKVEEDRVSLGGKAVTVLEGRLKV